MYESCKYYFKIKWKDVEECVSEDNDIRYITEKNRFKRKDHHKQIKQVSDQNIKAVFILNHWLNGVSLDQKIIYQINCHNFQYLLKEQVSLRLKLQAINY